MLTLAVIPAIALLVITVIVLRTRHLHHARMEKLRADTTAARQAAVDQDEANDQRLVAAISSSSEPISSLLQKHRATRAKIAPGANASDAAAWTIQDLERSLAHRAAHRATQIGRRLLYRTLLTAVAVIAIATGAAILRYHQISAAAAPVSATAQDDPLAALPADPFQLAVPDAASPAANLPAPPAGQP